MSDDFRVTYEGVDLSEYVLSEDVKRALQDADHALDGGIYINLPFTPLDVTLTMRLPIVIGGIHGRKRR